MSTFIGELLARLTLDNQFSPEMVKALKDVEGTSKALGKLGTEMQGAGMALSIGVTAPIVAIGAASAKAAIDFESSFAGVRKTVDATEPELAAMSNAFREMAQTIPVNVNELNNIAAAAGQLGIENENIVGFTRVMADLGVATNLSSDQAATALARLANITQMPQDQFENLGSTIVALGNNFATTESEIVEMGLRIAGAGEQIGLTEGEILAVGTALSSVGIEAEAGGTAISKVMIDMAASVSSGGEALGQFASVAGVSADEFAEKFRTNAAGALNDFIQGLGRMKQTGGDVLGTLEAMGITEVRMRDALLRASGAGDLLTRSLKLQGEAWKENDALSKEATTRYGTTASQLTILWNKVNDVAIKLGDALLPAIIGLVDAAEPMIDVLKFAVDMFTALPAPMQLTAIAAAGIVAAIGPMLFLIGGAATGVGALGSAFAAVTGTATGMQGAMVLLTGGLKLIPPVAATIAVAFGSWQIGTWIGQITGLTDTIGRWAAKLGELVGLLPEGTAAQYDATKAAEMGIPAIKALKSEYTGASAQAALLSSANNVIAQSLAETTNKSADFLASMRANEKAVNSLTSTQRSNIAEAHRLGASVEQIAAGFGIAESVVGRYVERLKEGETASKKLAAQQEKDAAAIREYYNWLGERQMEQAAAELKFTEDNAKAHRQMWNDIGVARMEAEAEQMAANERLEADYRQLWNDIGVARMEAEAAQMAKSAAMWTDFGKRISGVILQAFTGGGDVGKSVGSMLGGDIGNWAAKRLSGFLTKNIGGTFGKALGGIAGGLLGPLGSMAGGALGGLISKGLGKLFGGGEGTKVNDMRDKFVAAAGGIDVLNAKAIAAGMTLDQLLSARKVSDFENAVKNLNMGFEDSAAKLELAKTAAEEFGIPIERMGQKFKQAETDAAAGGMLEKMNALQTAGVDLATIAEFAGDEFGALVHNAIEMGTTVPREFEAIARKMIEQGTLLDKNGEAFTDLAQIPFAENLEEKFSSLIDKLDQFLDRLANIPSEINFDINGNMRVNGDDTNLIPMATGGLVTGPTPALVGEAGPELIVPLDRVKEMGGNDSAATTKALGDLRRDFQTYMAQQPRMIALAVRDKRNGA